MSEGPEYINGQLVLCETIDRGRYSIVNSYENEVGRIEHTSERTWLLCWGPLLRNEKEFSTFRDAMRWVQAHPDQIEFGDPEGET